MKTAFSLIVFDLDGTVIDSRRDLADSANAVLERCGLGALPVAALAGMVGDGAAALVGRAFRAAGGDPPLDALEQFLDEYNERLLRHTCEYPGIRDALSTLGSRSTLALLTNKPLEPTRSILIGLDLWRFFTGVLGGDGPYPRKPDPRGLLELVAGAGTDRERTVLIGDSLVDWSTARSAGTRVCLARYGFGCAEITAEECSRFDLVANEPSDLPRLL